MEKNIDIYNNMVATYEGDYDVYKNNMKISTAELKDKKVALDDMEKYMDESLLMSLDDDELLITRTDIALIQKKNTDSNEIFLSEEGITGVYNDYLIENFGLEDVCNKLDLSEEYVEELINVEIVAPMVIRISVIHPDEKCAKEITDMLLKAAQSRVDSVGFSYEYIVFNQKSTIENDEDLRNTIENKKILYENMKNDYNESEQRLRDYVGPEYPDKKIFSKTHILTNTMILFAAGLIFGLFVILFVSFNRFFKRGIVYSAAEFERISNVKNLCVMNNMYDKKNKSKNKDDNITDDEKAYDRLIIYLDNIGKDIKNILLIDKNEERANNITNMLKKKLEGKNIVCVNDINDNDTLKSLYDSDGAIAVYEKEKTTVKEIIDLKKFVYDNNGSIIGNIIV